MKLLESVKLIELIAWIEYSQQKIYLVCIFRHYFSSIHIEGLRTKLFIFSCIIRKQKKKIKPMF